MSTILEHFVHNITMMNIFGQRLKEIREDKGMSRKELADKLFVSVRLISYWEAGKRECNFEMLVKIADLFNESIDYLLGRKNF